MAQEDLLVKLYQLPDYQPGSFNNFGIRIKRGMAFEKSLIVKFAQSFSQAWADECEIAFANAPISCFIAYNNQKIIGFSCYNTTSLGFFGPTGVSKEHRNKGVGRALLLEALYAQKSLGYAYSIIGRAGSSEFYSKTVGATLIEGSNPGIYKDLIKH